MARSRPVVIRARGHRHITATHSKTFELATDNDIGRDATCVIGVAATCDWDVLGRLNGLAVVTVDAAGHHLETTARLSPFWSRGHGLVVRKSDFRGDDTLALESDRAAADLDRALVEALQDPSTAVDVAVRVIAPSRTVLFTDRLEARVPDGVRVIGIPFASGEVDVDGADDVLTRPGAALAAAAAVLGAGDEVLVLGNLPRGKRARGERLQSAPVVGVVTSGQAVEIDAPVATAVFRPGEVVAPVRVGHPTQRLGAEDRVFTVVKGEPTGSDVGHLLQALADEGVPVRTLRNAVARVPPLNKEWDYDALLRLE